MKRLSVLFALLLVLFLAAASGETASGKPDVFDLYDAGKESTLWTGTAIPLTESLLITSAVNLPEDTDHLALSDGNGFWRAGGVSLTERGHAAFIAFDEGENMPAAAVWPLLTASGLPAARDVYVYSLNEAGDQLYRAVSAVAPVTWENLDCMILTLSGNAAPGNPVLTDGGELAGMIAAEYAEGGNRYLAVTARGLADLMYEMYTAPGNGFGNSRPAEGFTVTAEGNQVTFDWSAAEVETPEGKELYLVVMDTGNDYLSFVRADEGKTSMTMLLTPGRTYLSGLTACEGKPSALPEQYAVTVLPEAEDLKEYGFQAVMTTLAVSEGNESVTERISEPLSAVSAEELRSGGMHFYSWSVYTVEEKKDDTLLITLTLPDGTHYQYASGWTFDPAYMGEDIWSLSLETMGFSEVLEKKGFPAGEYRMAYYVGGKLADAFVFEIR